MSAERTPVPCPRLLPRWSARRERESGRVPLLPGAHHDERRGFGNVSGGPPRPRQRRPPRTAIQSRRGPAGLRVVHLGVTTAERLQRDARPRSVASCRVRSGRKSDLRRRGGRNPPLRSGGPSFRVRGKIPSGGASGAARMAVSASRIPFCERRPVRSRCSGTSPRSAHPLRDAKGTSTDVVPAMTFSAPAARIVRIPRETASARIRPRRPG